jgi:hypothetical protein
MFAENRAVGLPDSDYIARPVAAGWNGVYFVTNQVETIQLKIPPSARRCSVLLSLLLVFLLPIRSSLPSPGSHGAAADESLTKNLGVRPFDQPEAAAAFFLPRRSPDGKSPIEMGRYLDALERMNEISRYSTALSQVLPPRSRPGATNQSAEVLGAWS